MKATSTVVRPRYCNHQKPIPLPHRLSGFNRTSSTFNLHKKVDRRHSKSAVDLFSNPPSSFACSDCCNKRKASTSSLHRRTQERRVELRPSKVFHSPCKRIHRSQSQLSLQASDILYGDTTNHNTKNTVTTTNSNAQSNGCIQRPSAEPKISCLRVVSSAADHIRRIHSQILPQLNHFSRTDHIDRQPQQVIRLSNSSCFIDTIPNHVQSQSIKKNQHIHQSKFTNQDLIATHNQTFVCPTTELASVNAFLSRSCPCIRPRLSKMATEQQPPVYEQQLLINSKQNLPSGMEPRAATVTSNRLLSSFSSTSFSSPSTCGLPKLSFNCQLAHGSPVHSLSGFSTMVELYDKISQAFTISADEVSKVVLMLNWIKVLLLQ